jgi:hypothetical protein
MQEIKSNKPNYFLLVPFACIFIYLLLRTFFVDITDDEAWSFYNVKKFWYVEALCSGNTHWFNFGAMKIAILLGLEKVWQLRWFSILSAFTLLLISYNYLRSFNCKAIQFFGFAFLFLNPYFLEYLTLARGYSSALAFLALSLMLLIRSENNNQKRSFSFPSLFFAGLSTISNYGFFYFFIAFSMIYFYRFHLNKGMTVFKSKYFYFDLFYFIGISSFVLRALLFIRECSNDIINFGGESLISSVFGDFFEHLFYGNFQSSDIVLTIAGILLAIVILISSIFGIINYKKHQDKLYAYSSLILLIMFLLTVFNKWIFNILYPTERTALMFYPLFALILSGFMKNSLMINTFIKKLMIWTFILFLLFNFYLSLNIDTGYDHPECKNSAAYFEALNQLNAKNVGMPLELYCVFVKYYEITTAYFKGESVNTYGHYNRYIKNNKLEDFDHLLLFYPISLSYYKTIKVKLKPVKFFPETKTVIVQVLK